MDEIETETETAAPAEKLEIINERFTCQGAPQGVLAACPGRGRILRWSIRSGHGEELFGYAAVPEDPARPAEILASPQDEVARFTQDFQAANNFRGGGRLLQFEKSAKDAEWERFRQAWPFVSEDLVARRREVERLFDPGAIHYHTGTDAEFGPIEFGYEKKVEFRDRHVSGDWGLIGRHDPGRLEDPVAAWLSGLQDQAFRNSYSIARGAGLVRSAYPIKARRPDLVVSVVTALIAGKEAITLMLVRHKNQTL
jgi:hypothetical protein